MSSRLPLFLFAVACLACGCSSLRSAFTGLPPRVDTHQVPGFDPSRATSVAVVVLVGASQGLGPYAVPTDRGVLVRALTDVVEARLTAAGYPVAAGRTIPQVIDARDPSALDAVAVAREVGADLVVVLTVNELRETVTPGTTAGAPSYEQHFDLSAKALGVASGRAGWTAEARGTAHLDGGSCQRVATEVAAAIAERFPARGGSAP